MRHFSMLAQVVWRYKADLGFCGSIGVAKFGHHLSLTNPVGIRGPQDRRFWPIVTEHSA